jgi:endonuclease/exonuclease/phosphatase family metal-dependent hydrolase
VTSTTSSTGQETSSTTSAIAGRPAGLVTSTTSSTGQETSSTTSAIAGRPAGLVTSTTSSTGQETSLGEAKIICIQEMNFNPERKAGGDYFPGVLGPHATHAIGANQIEPGGKRNGIFYKEGKFKLEDFHDGPIERALELMRYKKEAYDEIARGGDEKIESAVKGTLVCPDIEGAKKMMYEEVLEECKEARTVTGFHSKRQRFIRPKSYVTELPETLLKDRMAMCCLRVVGFDLRIVVISVHNYSKRSGKNAPLNFARLLFDFIEKLDVPVLIAGDFNLDVRPLIKGSSIQSAIKFDSIEEDSSRKDRRIDFILVKDRQGVLMIDTVKEHDLQMCGVPVAKKSITNHNPLSATICMRKKK